MRSRMPPSAAATARSSDRPSSSRLAGVARDCGCYGTLMNPDQLVGCPTIHADTANRPSMTHGASSAFPQTIASPSSRARTREPLRWPCGELSTCTSVSWLPRSVRTETFPPLVCSSTALGVSLKQVDAGATARGRVPLGGLRQRHAALILIETLTPRPKYRLCHDHSPPLPSTLPPEHGQHPTRTL